LTGGVGALVGSIITGPRTGRFVAEIDQTEFNPHNVTFVVLGTIILWFGWYGFNCGSTLVMNADAGKLAAQVAVNTTLSPAFAGLTVALVRRYQTGRWSAVSMCSGILAGLVSITAGCGSVHAHSAVIIGLIGACVYMFAADMMVKFKVDDPVEAFPIHGACGIWGVLATGFFDWGVPNGKYHAWGGFSPTEDATFASGMEAQIAGVFAIIAWSGFWLGLVFLGLKKANFLRISKEAEEVGLDDHEFSPMVAYAAPSSPKGTNGMSASWTQDQKVAVAP